MLGFHPVAKWVGFVAVRIVVEADEVGAQGDVVVGHVFARRRFGAARWHLARPQGTQAGEQGDQKQPEEEASHTEGIGGIPSVGFAVNVE